MLFLKRKTEYNSRSLRKKSYLRTIKVLGITKHIQYHENIGRKSCPDYRRNTRNW